MKYQNVKIMLIGMALAGNIQASIIGPDTTLSFDTGSSTLTNESKNKLKNIVKEARNKGTIDEVQVAVWSDNPTPRAGEQLSKSDQGLVNNRINGIHAYLKRLNVSDVDSYNMAEQASWLARVFHTDAAELKSEIGRGKDMPMSKEEFQIFKRYGDSSKAVVLVILK